MLVDAVLVYMTEIVLPEQKHIYKKLVICVWNGCNRVISQLKYSFVVCSQCRQHENTKLLTFYHTIFDREPFLVSQDKLIHVR